MAKSGWEGRGLEVLLTKDFDGGKLKRRGTYAVCFAATWCPPTNRFVPTFIALNGKIPAQVALADITDMEDPLWDTFHIDITPTMIVFKDGAEVGRFDGRPSEALDDRDLAGLTTLLKHLPS